MANLEIRGAEPSDIPAILGLLRELASYENKLDRVHNNEARLAEHAFGEKACVEVLVGAIDGEIVSYALFFPHYASFRGLPWLYLEDLYVRPSVRGSGVGRAMMARLARLTVDRGWPGMVWAVLDWNQPAFAFYRGLGAVDSNGHVAMELSGGALERLAGLNGG
jgi:GNAT superfamily N-acetyltransferase